MNRIFATLSLAIAAQAMAGATPAAAQVAGVYSGTSLDGDGVSFTVATDTGTGKLAVTGAGIGFSALCSRGGTLNTGWGYGLTQDITNRRVSNTTSGPYFTIIFSLLFSADGQSATGRVSTVSPTLDPVGAKPTRALFCRSKSQTLSVTLQPPTTHFNPPAQGAVWLGNTKTGAN
jgi:hypothetical protein